MHLWKWAAGVRQLPGKYVRYQNWDHPEDPRARQNRAAGCRATGEHSQVVLETQHERNSYDWGRLYCYFNHPESKGGFVCLFWAVFKMVTLTIQRQEDTPSMLTVFNTLYSLAWPYSCLSSTYRFSTIALSFITTFSLLWLFASQQGAKHLKYIILFL